MTIKIPQNLKTEFKLGFEEYIKSMGRKIQLFLPPSKVACPNCLFDNVQQKSAGTWNSSFLRPKNIFPGTTYQKEVYPQPFNVTTIPVDMVYNPSIPNPKILKSSICPVCKGDGHLVHDNRVDIKSVVTTMYVHTGAESGEYTDLSAGVDSHLVTRLKTFAANFAVCREAIYYMVDGVRMENTVPPRLKGLGNLSITEAYLVEVKANSKSTNFASDPRLNINTDGQASNQAPPGTPTIPPVVPGDDEW